MLIKNLQISFFLLFVFECTAQNLVFPVSSINNEKFLAEVKQLNQFFNRFNNEEIISLGVEKSDAEKLKEKENPVAFQISRKKTIISLLNHKDSAHLYNNTMEFINFVSNESNQIMLDFSDLNWFSTVNCMVIFEGKKHDITLTLSIEGNNSNGFKWSISGLNADFINLIPNRNDTAKFIGPMNHELGFMELHNVFNDYKNITEYTQKSYVPDKLSVFLYLVKYKKIQYINVNSIKYHFLQIPNWIFTVENFNRPNYNAGWLISSIQKTNTVQKFNYKKHILHLKL